MGAPLVPTLRQQIVNGSGAPYAGGLLYAYAAGSSTPQNTYSDSVLATPNANPIVADADGRFGAIYLDPALAYKFVFKTTAGVEIFSQDNVTITGTALLSVLSKTANYTVTVGDGEDVLVLVNATSGAVTLSLYTAIGNSGRKLRVIKTDTSTNTVTVDPFGSQTINGATTLVLRTQYDATAIASDGTNWLQLYRGLFPQVLSKSADYTVAVADGDDVTVLMDATGAARTVTLYTAVGNIGRRVIAKKTDSSTNAVTIDGNGSETIDGALTLTLSLQYEAAILESDGANWQVLSLKQSQAVDDANNILATQVFG